MNKTSLYTRVVELRISQVLWVLYDLDSFKAINSLIFNSVGICVSKMCFNVQFTIMTVTFVFLSSMRKLALYQNTIFCTSARPITCYGDT